MGHDKPDSTLSSNVIYFVSGLGAVIMGYSMYSHLKSFQERNAHAGRHKRVTLRNASNTKIEDSIALKSLAFMTQSTNMHMQTGAFKIILDRAMSDTYLPMIIRSCAADQPFDTRNKALSSLQLLTRRERNRPALLAAGTLNVLVDALKCNDPRITESTKRYAAISICDLIQGSDEHKHQVVELGVLGPVKQILTSDTIQHNELKYWTLMILYQVSLSDPFPSILIHQGFIPVLAKMARATFGNTNMPKFCLQSLVRIIASLDATDAKTILTELLNYGMVDLISICLRGEDVELIYWAAGLMHEFVLKDVAADRFRSIKGVHVILTGLLAAEEMYISRVILRTIKFMANDHENFRKGMVDTGMVAKIMRCLTLNDDDVRYWAIMCIHAVAEQWESHLDIIHSNEFPLLMELGISRRAHVAVFVSDILSLICCLASNGVLLENHVDTVVSTLNNLINYDEIEVQYNAAGAIFNLMVMNDDFAAKVGDGCFDTLISMCVASTNERIQLTCAKTLLLLAIKYQFIVRRITLHVIEPLINSTSSISQMLLPIMMMQTLIASSRSHTNTATDRRRRKLPLGDLHMSQMSDSSRTASQTDLLFASEDIPDHSNDGVARLMKFELPLSSRLQLVGALSALRILLENEVFYNVISETDECPTSTTDFSRPEDMPEHDDFEAFNQRPKQRTGRLSDFQVSLTSHTSPAALPQSMKRFIELLVRLAIYPVMNIWAPTYRHNFTPEDMKDADAERVYTDLLHWIKTSTHVATEKTELARVLAEPGLPGPVVRLPNFGHGGESSDDSEEEGEDDDHDDRDDPTYAMARKVESAAERVGETRRKGEEDDSAAVDDTVSVCHPLHFSTLYSAFASRALMVLRSLVRYASVRQFVIQELNFVEAMICMSQHCRSLSDHILTCLGTMISTDASYVMDPRALQVLVISIWKRGQLPMMEKKSFHFYARLILAFATRCVSPSCADDWENNPVIVEIDVHRRTRLCLLNYQTRLEARNDAWTFETIRGTHCTPPRSTWQASRRPHKYAYEIVLATDGLMQVGWVTDEFGVDPEAGTGVGDDAHSYGYDGRRVKKWHCQDQTRRIDYGLRWAVGDVITCAIDLECGEIRYYQNGQDLGVAFSNIDTDKRWYPAVSLSTGQECRVRFGSTLDKLRHLPQGYRPVMDLAREPEEVEQPSPEPHGHTEEPVSPVAGVQLSMEEDDDEVVMACLADAIDRMRIKALSPDMPSQEEEVVDHAEPSVRPIDRSFDTAAPTGLSDVLALYPKISKEFSVLPSLYFEAAIAFYPEQTKEKLPADKPPITVTLGYQSLRPNTDVRLECHVAEKMAYISVGQDARTHAFSFEIQDGDVIGLFYVQEMDSIGVTKNGTMIVMCVMKIMALGGKIRPYIPYRAGTQAKTHINYGESLFRWQRANTIVAKEKMHGYLDRLHP